MTAETAPAPGELGMVPVRVCGEMAVRASLLEVLFEDGEGRRGGLLRFELGVGDGGEGLAQFPDLANYVGALGLGGVETLELLRLALGENLRLGGEAEQVVVVDEQLLGTAWGIAVVEGVDEIEGDVAGD